MEKQEYLIKNVSIMMEDPYNKTIILPLHLIIFNLLDGRYWALMKILT